MGITETKLKTTSDPIFNIKIDVYQCYSTPTETSEGGALLYIADQFDAKPLTKLKIMYNPNMLESIFVEICNKNKNKIIIGCIYRQPSMVTFL